MSSLLLVAHSMTSLPQILLADLKEGLWIERFTVHNVTAAPIPDLPHVENFYEHLMRLVE
jgi:hypothetical protein